MLPKVAIIIVTCLNRISFIGYERGATGIVVEFKEWGIDGYWLSSREAKVHLELFV